MARTRETGHLARVVDSINSGRLTGEVTVRDIALITGLTVAQASSVALNAATRTKIMKREGLTSDGAITYLIDEGAAKTYKVRGSRHLVKSQRKTGKKANAGLPNPIEDLLNAMAEAEPVLRKMADAYNAMKALDKL